MKLIKLSFVIAVAVMAIMGISTTSYAFHDGGVARCESCHTMHNSFQQGAMSGTKNTTPGAYGTGDPTKSAIYLLRGSDQSSTCLNCHEGPSLSSYHVSTDAATISAAANKAPVNRGPGGDFGWLRSATTSTVLSVDRHGHNIVAVDFGYTSDATNLNAPGGSYLATSLNCISCHNPHNNARRTDESGTKTLDRSAPIVASGSYADSPVATTSAAVGVYRFLGTTGYAPKSYQAVPFSNPVPDAVAPHTYNRSESLTDTAVAYGQGMSSWCLNCHPKMDGSGYATGTPSHPHPTDRAIDGMSATYTSYVKTGDMSGNGVTKGGYSSLVALERGNANYTTLKTQATNTGLFAGLNPDVNSKVMCLTCHRAHAGGFNSMLRWYMDGTITDTAGNYTLASGQTLTTQVQAAYYDRANTVFATYQRALCNKCHAKD